MRLSFVAAVAAVSFGSPVAAAESDLLYSACQYQDGNTGVNPFTALFVVDAYALKDDYGEFTFAKNKAWEELMATDAPYAVRRVSGYYSYNLVGQFKKFAEEKGDTHGWCWVTTDKDRALRWYREQLDDKGRAADGTTIRDWRPAKGSYLRIEDWPPM